MKNPIFIICFVILATSCAVPKPISAYLKKVDVRHEKFNHFLLFNAKLSKNETIKLYRGQIFSTGKQVQPINYSENLYQYLVLNNESTPNLELWTKKDAREWNLVFTEDFAFTAMDRLIYCISAPLYSEDKRTAIFGISRSRGMYQGIDRFVVIMKYENRKWIFVERFYTTELH